MVTKAMLSKQIEKSRETHYFVVLFKFQSNIIYAFDARNANWNDIWFAGFIKYKQIHSNLCFFNYSPKFDEYFFNIFWENKF